MEAEAGSPRADTGWDIGFVKRSRAWTLKGGYLRVNILTKPDFQSIPMGYCAVKDSSGKQKR